MTTKKIEVTRAFCIGGERQEVGKVLEVSPVFAAELIHSGKAMTAAEKPARAKKAAAEKPVEAAADPVEITGENNEPV